MATPVAKSSSTLLTQLVAHLLEAAEFNADDVAPPAVVLWPDKASEWTPLLPALRKALPQLLTLGTHDPATRTGPGIWLKCMVAGTLPEAALPSGTVPILYLPGVSLKDLRNAEEAPRALQPLAELQYRGRTWAHVNGRDWSVLAFLTSSAALGLNVAGDVATGEAVRRALPQLAHLPTTELSGRLLDSYDFDEMVTGGDSVRDVLRWIDSPASIDSAKDPAGWAAFRNICKKDFHFDPAQDGRLGAAERMGRRDGKWRKVWERFAEAPANWLGVPEALRQARPKDNADFFAQASRGSWPQENEEDEKLLRDALLKLEHASPVEVAARLATLEQEHAERRGWVWSTLGKAPLASALEHLHALAVATAKPVVGTSRDEMAEAYRADAWKADAAVLYALGAVRENDDARAVRAVVRALYLPWLAQAADRLQKCIQTSPLPTHGIAAAEVPAHTVILFVDGLRLDVAERLRDRMTSRGWSVQGTWRWSALPSVTPTAKPAVSPVADLLTADYAVQEFSPNVGKTAKALTTHAFRAMLADQGVPYVSGMEIGDPHGRAWTEVGDLDGYGHEQGWKLAWRVPEVLRDVEGRIAQLFAAGWKRVRIVTDHGWLLMPGGLPKTELPGYVADARWARCAALKPGATPDVPLVPWYWNPQVMIAVAPGVSAFVANAEYAHGGVSLQECVTQVLEVTSGAAQVRNASIAAVRWLGLLCKIKVTGHAVGCTVDLRTFAANPATTIAEQPKQVDSREEISLHVSDDEQMGCSAQVVLLDESGTVIAKHPTTVGDQ